MTEDNRKENIRAELVRATEALAAATLLYENGYISDAISRLYYFVLYNVRALLLSKGLEPRSHDGALRLLGLHFVRDGLMDKRAAQVFSKADEIQGRSGLQSHLDVYKGGFCCI